MQSCPLRSSVIGSYPFPSWLEFASQHLEVFGRSDVSEIQDDAVIAAVHDQIDAGLDVITDGEQTRLDFNLSFYGYIEGIELESSARRRTINEANTPSQANFTRPGGSGSLTNSNGCNVSRRLGRR